MAKAKTKAAEEAEGTPEGQQVEQALAAPAAPAVELLIVEEGHLLFWPIGGFPSRGGPGTVVRADDPFIRGKDYFPDQGYKFRKPTAAELAAGLELTPCNNRRIAELCKEQGIDWLPVVNALLPTPVKPKAPPEDQDFEVPALDPEPPKL